MKIMILGFAGHGKTEVANILKHEFGFIVNDATDVLIHKTAKMIASNDLVVPPEFAQTLQCNRPIAELVRALEIGKQNYRMLLKTAIDVMCHKDKTTFVREVFRISEVYAGCRNPEQYTAAKNLIDLTFWVENPNTPKDDPSMLIQYDPKTMIHLNNSGTLAYLEAQIKKALATKAKISINYFDKTWRDALISGLAKQP